MNFNLALTHPGWLLVMIFGFIFWWPIGLVVLAIILWSGSMGRMNGQWWERLKSLGGYFNRSTGNFAFDEHRKETLRTLEEEEVEFRAFIDKVRFAKDKQSFDDFIKSRKVKP